MKVRWNDSSQDFHLYDVDLENAASGSGSTLFRVTVSGIERVRMSLAGVLIGPVITPTQIAANTDDWNPTGLATAARIRASTDASRNLTGIVAQPDGTRIVLMNVGAQSLVLKHDATSTAANRFYGPNSADVTVRANGAVVIEYDATSSRWRIFGA